MEHTVPSSSTRGVAKGTVDVPFDALLVDDMIAEVAQYLVSPFDYWALARASARTWCLLGRQPQPRLHMETCYFHPWRTVVTLGTYSRLDDVIQTPGICLAAVQQNGHALEYVRTQTLALCLAAVQQDGHALEYVKTQTPAICLAAVQQDGWALRCVQVQTPEVCLAAVQQDGGALAYVKVQTPELRLAALREDPGASLSH